MYLKLSVIALQRFKVIRLEILLLLTNTRMGIEKDKNYAYKKFFDLAAKLKEVFTPIATLVSPNTS